MSFENDVHFNFADLPPEMKIWHREMGLIMNRYFATGDPTEMIAAGLLPSHEDMLADDPEVSQMVCHESAEYIPHPIEMCYWVIPGKLLAGEYPRTPHEDSSKEKLAALIGAGVSAFIDLTEPYEPTSHGEPMKPYDYFLDGPSHQRFGIRDQSIPASSELTKAALDAIDAHLATGETVYVHCWGGVGRTGTIIGCWLARHYKPGQAALDRLQELWKENPKSLKRCSPENAEQVRYILEWSEDPA